MTPANLPTPPAWDIKPEGLRIWQDGKVVAIIPQHYYANLALALIKQMQDSR